MSVINKALSAYKQGETQSISNDGHIGIPTEITVYYDKSKGNAVPGYMTKGGTPVILYVVNAIFERVGTKSDTEIISSMLDRGYIVVVLDYKNNEKAVSPALEWSAQLIRSKVESGSCFPGNTLLPKGSYKDTLVVPSGNDVLLSQTYFALDKHGVDGTLEKIVNVWNHDFRLYKKDVVVKWVHSDGTRKATQDGHDGSAPLWYSDAVGKKVDATNGIYVKVKHTKAEVITDCVNADGTPIDLDLRAHVIYPTAPKKEVPVMTIMSSAGYLTTGVTKTDRPHFVGFGFNGYATAVFDYAYIPMARDDSYAYFDGSSGSGKSVTGDNQTYASYTFNSAQTSTAGLRYVRYLALSNPSEYKFDIESIGSYGISKSAWLTQVGAPALREDLLTTSSNGGMTEAQIVQHVNNKINNFYQQLILPGHHGETRYDNGKTESYTKDGFTIDGGEPQPFAVYGGKEISSGAQIVYSSCGAVVDYLEKDFSPLFITVNLNDTYNHGYNMQNVLVNACRSLDIPALWLEADIAHTFAQGDDYIYGIDTYKAFFDLSDYYLKGAPVKVAYTSPLSGSVIEASSKLTVKFIGAVSESEIVKVTITDASGNKVKGDWISAYGETEWTFIPDSMRGNTVYTLTVPDTLVGDNGIASGEDCAATFVTLPEVTTGFSSDSDIIVTTAGTYFSFTAPTVTDGYNRVKLRMKATNDAVNTLLIYSADAAGDTKGAYLGKVAVNGIGTYEFDVTDYVLSKAAGTKVCFMVRTRSVAGNIVTASEDFDNGLGIFSKNQYSTVTNEIFQSQSVAKIVRITNTGKFNGEHSFYDTQSAIYSTKLINSGTVTKEDLGRKFLVTIKVYDTISRPLRLIISGITDKNSELRDYNRPYYPVQTKANEWVEFAIPYTVYEANYGIMSATKKFEIFVNTDGDKESSLYIDKITVSEIFTDISVSNASLVSYMQRDANMR